MSILSAHSTECFSLFSRSMIQAGELPMAEMLDDQLIKDVFEEEGVEFGIASNDVFTPAITLWAMVSQFLHSKTAKSVKAAAGRVVSLFAQLEGRVVAQNAGNYCRAKAKIPAFAIRKITLAVASKAEHQATCFDDLRVVIEADQAEERRCPRVIASIRGLPVEGRILSVDGFTIDAPDTPENRAKYPKSNTQGDGLGFPILRCVALISMTTGLLIDLAKAPYCGKGTGETALLRQMLGTLRPGDTLVADCYYCTYWLIAMCLKKGVHVVMRNHHKRDDHPEDAKEIDETQRIAIWVRPVRPKWMSKRDYRQIPQSLSMRLCDITPQQSATRCEGFTIATTMLDHAAAPKFWIGSFYEGRWMVEPDIRSIKCIEDIEHLRSRTPEGIEREIWTGLLTYNLVQAKMLQSGAAANRDPRSMSFTETYQLLSTNWLLCACVGVSVPMAVASQAQGACAVIGQRPGRVEPRENKRRPKTIKLMTISRQEFHASRAALLNTG